ncbi:hypothetical protein ACFWPU_05495 [Streptomyces sp. NPDC058471]|uniref:hypothetical protein n=1 Tax=Streptomyces sp. NPDC058471 TaxID=3346516 RepID=UPI00365E978D
MAQPEKTAARYLLSDLDPLPYPRRMREIAESARDFAGRGALRSVLEELESGGPYERQVAIMLACAGRDAEWTGARLADPDAFVRGHALRVAESHGVPDTAFEAALDDAPEAVRRQLLRAILAGHRTALADRVVDPLRQQWGDTEAARLLPGCSGPVVERLLPELFHSVRGWRPLARRHAGVLLDVAARELEALPEALRDAWWQRYATGIAAVTKAEPLRVLDLLDRFAPSAFPVRLRPCLGVLADAAPGRVLTILSGPWGWPLRRGCALTASVLRKLARSGAPELLTYARTVAEDPDASDGLARLMRAHAPADRAAVHARAVEGRGPAFTGVDDVILGALPRSAVAEEARRMAERAKEQGTEWSAVLLAESFLPCAEVRDRLVAATRRPSAADRAEAWPLLVRNAARSGESAHVTAVLEEMTRLANEQDPVRAAALTALAETRPALFGADAEPFLDRISADAVAARDSSYATRGGLSRLAVAVLREHAAGGRPELVNWALRTLVRISGNTGGADLGRLDHTLRRGQEHDVFEALRPWIEAGAEKADHSLTFALARAVGRRAAGMPELQELLWQAIRFGSNATMSRAIDLWLEPAATRDERVARVLAQEPSTGVLAPVLDIVCGRRTDLLDPLLSGTPPYGRFLVKGAAWTVRADARHIHRWLPRQQAAYARQLARTAGDAGLPQRDRALAIARGAHVPGPGEDLVRRWTGSPDTVLAEAALGALAHISRPGDALPELLAHAGGERARVAVYAATQASRHVAPSRLAALLREVLCGPGKKVTSRKEAARLAAVRLPAAEAAALLGDAYEAPDAHRDVRAACVAFAAGLLGEERVWGLLSDAAGREAVLRAAVLRVRPLDLAEGHRERYARLVRETVGTRDDDVAGVALDALARWAPWSPDAAAVLADAVADLDRRATWQVAARGLVTAAATAPRGTEALCGALAALAGSDVPASPDRDLPARRRIEYVAQTLAEGGEAYRAPGLAAGGLLAGYADYVPQAAEILVAAVDVDGEPEEVGEALLRLARLHEGRPALAMRSATALTERLADTEYTGRAAGCLLPVTHRLADAGGHANGLFALAVTDALGERTNWSEPWRGLLMSLRAHAVPDVRDAALTVCTSYE